MDKLSALNFKKNELNLTQKRVEYVMQYIIYCYQKMRNEGKIYDYSKKGKISKENYLRNGLVDDYLNKKPNIDFYKKQITKSDFSDLQCAKEENQVYVIDNVLANDFIDINIFERKLSEHLSLKTDDPIRLAVECKRVNKPNDYNEYVKDIEKFTARPFVTFRLPIEGQICFIENDKLTHTIVSNEINLVLDAHTTIKTDQNLKPKFIMAGFNESYDSKHKRNYGINQQFSIYHLLLDYSKIIFK